jgi:hypothetical protein
MEPMDGMQLAHSLQQTHNQFRNRRPRFGERRKYSKGK